MLRKPVYLDYAAATPLDPGVLEAMLPYFSQLFFNPSADYDQARAVKAIVNASRSRVAQTIGAKSGEIVFTAGATEANNLALHGVMASFPDARLIVSAIEHPSILNPAKKHKAAICPVYKDGLIKLDNLTKLIDDKTVLVSLILASHEIGVIEPISEVAKLLEQVKKDRYVRGVNLPIYLHTDGSQAANYLDLHVARLGVDLMSLNGGKMYGPKQSGVLFIKSGVKLTPLIDGGGQENGLRSGTENVAGIVGFSESLMLAQACRKAESLRVSKLSEHFILRLKELFPGSQINGSLKKRLVSNVHVTFPSVDNEWLLIKLDSLGIMAAAGSACSASSTEPSTVLKAIGLSGKDAQSSIRFSLGKYTTLKDIDYTLSSLKNLIS